MRLVIMRFLVVFMLSLLGVAFGQSSSSWQCGSQAINDGIRARLGIDSKALEAHIQRLIARKRTQEADALRKHGYSAPEPLLTIPLVFHVFQPPQAQTGIGIHLSDHDLQLQVAALNQYFRNTHPQAKQVMKAFAHALVDTRIEFALARQDTAHMPTNGIIRRTIPNAYAHVPFQNDEIRRLASVKWSPLWDVERYINVYVFPQANMWNASGWAIYPIGNLEGIGYTNRRGAQGGGVYHLPYPMPMIAMATEAMYNANRGVSGAILAHEIGHYLGLVHTFGDESRDCSADDYCADTPLQDGNPKYRITDCYRIQNGNYTPTCGSKDMFQNIMAYANQACQFIFTPCQKERMRTILLYSHRGNTLYNNDRLVRTFAVHANDLGMVRLSAPNRICASSFFLEAQVGNYGTNTIKSYEVAAYIGDTKVATYTHSSHTLGSYGIHRFRFPAIHYAANSTGEVLVSVRVEKVNGVRDTHTANNQHTVVLNYPRRMPFNTVREDFQKAQLETWTMDQAGQQVARFQRHKGLDTVMVMPFHTLTPTKPSESFGQIYSMYSPVFSLNETSHQSGRYLRFAYSYTAKKGHFLDGLYVSKHINVCSGNPKTWIAFHKNGADLATSSYSPDAIVPEEGEWRDLTHYLAPSSDENDFQIGLHFINGGGSHLYIDDLELVRPLPSRQTEPQLKPVHIPDLICNPQTSMVLALDNPTHAFLDCEEGIYIKKMGTNTPPLLYPLKRLISPNSACIGAYDKASLVINPYSPLGFSASQSERVEYAMWYQPKNSTAPYDSLYYHLIHVDASRSVKGFPLRHDFSNAQRDWVLKPVGVSKQRFKQHVWQRTSTLDGSNGYLKGSFYKDLASVGDYMLALPLMDNRYARRASLSFKVAYAMRLGAAGERLRVVVLKEGCNPYSSVVVYDKQAQILQTAPNGTSSAWAPTKPQHWRREHIDITPYAAKGPISILFIASSQGGNHLYIDDIAVTGEEGNLLAASFQDDNNKGIIVYPNPARNRITVKFPEDIASSIEWTLFNEGGGLVYTESYRLAKDEIELLLPDDVSGTMYFLGIRSDRFFHVQRIILK